MSKEKKTERKKAKLPCNPELEYLRTLYSRYRVLLDTLDNAMRSSRGDHPKHYEDPLGSVSFFTYIKFFIRKIERTEINIQKAADTIKEGIDGFKCPIAQDAKITIATIYRLNHKLINPLLKLEEWFLEDQEEDYWDGEDFKLGCLYSDALKLQEQHCLIDRFIKDLLITETRVLLEIKSIAGEKIQLKKQGAEKWVERILDESPDNNWNPRIIQDELLNYGCKYSHVSIRTLDAWKKWKKKHPRRKHSFVALTDLSMKSIDSTGKTHFSRKKNASNYSEDDD